MLIVTTLPSTITTNGEMGLNWWAYAMISRSFQVAARSQKGREIMKETDATSFSFFSSFFFLFLFFLAASLFWFILIYSGSLLSSTEAVII